MKRWAMFLLCGMVSANSFSSPSFNRWLLSFLYVSPVNFPISLAGNFGEPRPNHFHGGIDVRTQMAEGKAIFSISDGYVSRVTVGKFGFGNAVYVRHPNGTTSVYCHLKRFVPQLNALVGKLQVRHQPAEQEYDIWLKPWQMPVSEGQLIAVSGDTGSSVAPHLHLEIRDTKTWAMLDPLDYLKDFLQDTTPPQAHAFMVYPQEGAGVFNGSAKKQYFGFTSNHLERVFNAWGRVGFALWANDYMEETYHHYGIRQTQLLVDDSLVFFCDVNNIPHQHNLMVNSWGDYAHYRRSHVWYMKSFADPGNRLPILHVDDNRGIVCFDEERDYHLVYILTDAFGNQSQYSFVVKGQKQTVPHATEKNAANLLKWNLTNCFQRPGMQLYVRQGLLPDDVELHPHVKQGTKGLSDAWSFRDDSYPMFGNAVLSIRLKHPVNDPSKICLVGNDGREYDAIVENGWVYGKIRDLGLSYEAGYKRTNNKKQQ